jgi:DNA modification methylase
MIIDEKKIKKIDDIEAINKKLVCGETLSFLQKLPDNSVQQIVTSPSYFLGKSYEKSHEFDEYINEHVEIIKECHRVLKDNGSIFWNVAQTVINKEILPLGAIFYEKFKNESFYMKNWIIWKFEGGESPRTRLFGRYENILWFVKNNEDYIFNVDDVRIPAKWIRDKRVNPNGKNPEDLWVFDERSNEEKLSQIKEKMSKFKKLISEEAPDYVNQILMDELTRDIEFSIDEIIQSKENVVNKNLTDNIWHLNRVVNVSKAEKIKHPTTGVPHPCPFPESLIRRIIKMGSNEGDIILDIFNGSGTVPKVAEELNRGWIGVDKELDYCEISEYRIKNMAKQNLST